MFGFSNTSQGSLDILKDCWSHCLRGDIGWPTVIRLDIMRFFCGLLQIQGDDLQIIIIYRSVKKFIFLTKEIRLDKLLRIS